MRSTADKIHTALLKLKNESNTKELELIELIASIYETVQGMQKKASEKISDTAHVVNTSIHLHPWYYMGAATLAGFLIGLIFRKKIM